MLQVLIARNEVELLRETRKLGLSLEDLRGPYTNASGHPYVFFDDGAPSTVPDPTPGRAGVSGGAGSGTVELGSRHTSVTGEVLGAVAASFTGTTASQVVIPGTVVIDDSGSTGPTIIDDGNGVLLEQITKGRRGTINYYTGAVVINYHAGENPTGNVEVDYDHSSFPDMTDMPEVVDIQSLVIERTAGVDATTDFTIFEDEAKTVPRAQGTLTFGADAIATIGFFQLVSRTMEVADLTKRGKRWIEFTSADTYTVSASWARYTS